MDFDLDAAGFSAVVLAGGTAARMGGIDKASVEYAGRSLLTYALDALLDADEVVVVGEQVPTHRPVTFVREDPPHGGPVAGFLAGVDALLRPPRLVAVLAVDMPHVTPRTMRRLREAVRGRGAAFLLDPASARRQLAGVFDATRLAEVRPDLEARHNMPMHRLLDALAVVDVAAVGREACDVDTWADLRDLAAEPGEPGN